MFRSAGSAEIIRSHQKDDAFVSQLRSSLNDIIHSIAGPRVWLHWRRYLDLTADLSYFLLTTCSDLQTVGEEYVNLVQTDSTLRALPSKWRRAVMIGLQVCAPYIFQSALAKFEQQLQTSTSLPFQPVTREAILAALPLLRKAVVVTHRLHLAIFYINGVFYHLGKRFSGVRYVQYMAQGQNKSSFRPFQILGYLSLAQLLCSLLLNCFHVAVALREQKKNIQTDELSFSRRVAEKESLPVHPRDKCPLCLGRRDHSALTPCGHLFCWYCIHEWCLTKAECPICRDQFSPQGLIVLQNYDMR